MHNLSDVVFVEQAPTAEDFVALRELIGWGSLAVETAQKSLANSLFHVSAYRDEQLVAAGRVVGDGHMYFYIQDVIVHPASQGLGLGAKVMTHIESYLQSACTKGATVGLFAAKGKEGFYKKYNYIVRTGEPLGMGMCRFVK